MIISLHAGGMTVRDIAQSIERAIGTELTHDTISKIIDLGVGRGQGLAGQAAGRDRADLIAAPSARTRPTGPCRRAGRPWPGPNEATHDGCPSKTGTGHAGRHAQIDHEPATEPGVIESVVALAAVYGGVGLIAGNSIHVRDDWLVGTPFGSWVAPGALLLVVVAVPMTGAAALELRRSPWAAVASVTAGAAQIGWITAQLAIMQRYSVLQPAMMLLGLVVVLVAIAVRRREPLRPPGR